MLELHKGKYTGSFDIEPGRSAIGELTVAGRKTLLELSDPAFIGLAINSDFLQGTLTDHTKITLVDCLGSGPGTRFTAGGPSSHHETVFPHHIVWGREHLDPTATVIEEILFEVLDAIPLFYDFDAFGSVTNASRFIDEVLRERREHRKVEVGAHPQILYFTGKSEIFAADTTLGRLSANHLPSFTLGSPRGVALNNSIFCGIKFAAAVAFEDALAAMWVYARFLTIVAGRFQPVLRCRLRTSLSDLSILNVYSTLTHEESREDDEGGPHPADLPLNGGVDPAHFANVC